MQIDYLADHIELAPVLAAWHHAEWGTLLRGWSLEQAETELRGHVNRRSIPTTFVAMEQGQPVGSASLLESDLDGWERLSPWLASVYVVPQQRGKGIGRLLVARSIEEARLIQVRTLYLFTAGQEAYYARLGWSPFGRTAHNHHSVLIMCRTWGGAGEDGA